MSYPHYFYRYGPNERAFIKRISDTRFYSLHFAQAGDVFKLVKQPRETDMKENLDLYLMGCPFVPGLNVLYETLATLLDEHEDLQRYKRNCPLGAANRA